VSARFGILKKHRAALIFSHSAAERHTRAALRIQLRIVYLMVLGPATGPLVNCTCTGYASRSASRFTAAGLVTNYASNCTVSMVSSKHRDGAAVVYNENLLRIRASEGHRKHVTPEERILSRVSTRRCDAVSLCHCVSDSSRNAMLCKRNFATTKRLLSFASKIFLRKAFLASLSQRS